MDSRNDVQGFAYDAYLCFAEADRERVERDIIAPWLAAGLRLATVYEIGQDGAFFVTEIQRGIEQSRYTVVLLSPEYLQDRIAEFTDAQAQLMSIEEGKRRFKPALLTAMPRANIPLRFRAYVIRDLTVATRFEKQFALLTAALKEPLQTVSTFVSYSTTDELFAHRLYDDLQRNGVRVWFAPEDLRTGDILKQTIDASIQSFDKLILVLSENSIYRAWVRYECGKALEKEKQENKLVLFPIRLDGAIFSVNEPWAQEIRQRQISDFTNWTNPLLYQNAINRLLRDLNAKA